MGNFNPKTRMINGEIISFHVLKSPEYYTVDRRSFDWQYKKFITVESYGSPYKEDAVREYNSIINLN